MVVTRSALSLVFTWIGTHKARDVHSVSRVIVVYQIRVTFDFSITSGDPLGVPGY